MNNTYPKSTLALAIAYNNEQLGDNHLSHALNFELPNDGHVPEWVELIPAPGTDNRINGRDVRYWFMRNAHAVTQQSLSQQRDISGD